MAVLGSNTLNHSDNLLIQRAGSTKLTVTSTGTEVTGIITASSFHVPNATSGTAISPSLYTFSLAATADPIGPSVADVFATPSSLSLEASSVYKITAFVVFLKTIAGTATWRQLFSAATAVLEGYQYVTPVTGMTASTAAAYTPIQQYFYMRGVATHVWDPSVTNLTASTLHLYRLDATVGTNAAVNWRLRFNQSGAGTITVQAGSYYTIEKLGASTGTFVA
jgi:hypothetical protein